MFGPLGLTAVSFLCETREELEMFFVDNLP